MGLEFPKMTIVLRKTFLRLFKKQDDQGRILIKVQIVSGEVYISFAAIKLFKCSWTRQFFSIHFQRNYPNDSFKYQSSYNFWSHRNLQLSFKITVSAWMQPRGSIFHSGFLGEVLFKPNPPGVVFEVRFYWSDGKQKIFQFNFSLAVH